MFNLIRLDGLFEGEYKWELERCQVDKEFDNFTIGQLDSAGSFIFVRVSFERMASFWSSPTAMKNHPMVATRVNLLPKFFFSWMLDKAEWYNTCLIKDEAVAEMKN